jgi:hypothetical protein
MPAYLTPDQISAAERDVMERRGERSRASHLAKAAAATAPADLSPADVVGTWVIGRNNQPHFAPQQMQELVDGSRAQYVRYADSPEKIELMEAKLAAALKADGLPVPQQTPEDRLKALRERHAAKGN